MATKSIAWNTGSGNITLTYTGQGDGTITVDSDANGLGTARSQTITVQTTGGAVTKNLTVSQAACPFPIGDVKTYSYTGSYQEVELPAGQYKLQVWGAQGGSNAAASSYSITAKAGGKGGYSEGIITLSTKTTVRVYVGGQGSSSAGGFNGGGSTTGSASYNASNENGVSRMGGGGGATDIRLSDGALLSRMIVAGGGAGGAMCYRSKTTTTTSWTTVATFTSSSSGTGSVTMGTYFYSTNQPADHTYSDWYINLSTYDFRGKKVRVKFSGSFWYFNIGLRTSSGGWLTHKENLTSSTYTYTVGTDSNAAVFNVSPRNHYAEGYYNGKVTIEVETSSSSTSTSTDYQAGGVGGGTQGGGYSSSYVGKQNASGSGGSFGQGAAQSVTNYRYCSGAGGGGWYGGGSSYSDSSMTNSKYAGGGSGFVNTAASAGNRPSGYTGLQLDSGTTYSGSTSFPSTSGGTETGHSGNGYAKITRQA